jgi:short-subunit dehydrogenase
MVERGHGRIINVASAAGRIPAPSAAVYSATKAAVATLTEAVRIELRGTGVYVTAILPTFVPTGMAAGLRTRGIPKTSAERIASIAVDMLKRRRPPASVTIPRWVSALALADTASPDWMRQIGRRIFMVKAAPDSPERDSYRKRIARQTTIHSKAAATEDIGGSTPEKES